MAVAREWCCEGLLDGAAAIWQCEGERRVGGRLCWDAFPDLRNHDDDEVVRLWQGTRFGRTCERGRVVGCLSERSGWQANERTCKSRWVRTRVGCGVVVMGDRIRKAMRCGNGSSGYRGRTSGDQADQHLRRTTLELGNHNQDAQELFEVNLLSEVRFALGENDVDVHCREAGHNTGQAVVRTWPELTKRFHPIPAVGPNQGKICKEVGHINICI
eukprot:1180909-Prorocentrum_minimum.AAC.1